MVGLYLLGWRNSSRKLAFASCFYAIDLTMLIGSSASPNITYQALLYPTALLLPFICSSRECVYNF